MKRRAQLAIALLISLFFQGLPLSVANADDTYERICLTMGWIECGTWDLFDSNGERKNSVIGPASESELRAICGENLCGAGPGGRAVLRDRIYPSAPLIDAKLPSSESPSTQTSPPQQNTSRTNAGFGGYAVIHPNGWVCGVIVANGDISIMSIPYMGCPAGSAVIFQSKPSPSGNVAGWSGRDVLYLNGTFYLSSGTTIRDGIATDPNGRVWDTGSGETLVPGKTQTPSTASNTVSSSVSQTASSSLDSSSKSNLAKGNADRSQISREVDDTYSRICLTLGWVECGVWAILNSSGVQVNRVVGPWPESKLRVLCGSTLCGGGVGAQIELETMLFADSPEPNTDNNSRTKSPVVQEPTSNSALPTQSSTISSGFVVQGSSIQISKIAHAIFNEPTYSEEVVSFATQLTALKSQSAAAIRSLPRNADLVYQVSSNDSRTCMASTWRVRFFKSGLCEIRVTIEAQDGTQAVIVKKLRRS